MHFWRVPYLVYYSNASDAFFYMSFAETTKVVPWDILVSGSSLGNLSGAAALANQSNTSLYTARFINLPLQISHCIVLGGFSFLTGVPAYRLFQVLNLFSFIAASGAFVLLCSRLGLSRWQAALTSITMSVGFWAQVCREHDALASNLATPVTLLFCLALQGINTPGLRTHWRSVVFLAIAAALLTGAYFPIALVMGLVAFCYLAFGLVDRTAALKENAIKATLAALGALMLLVLSGQASYLWRCLWFFLRFSSKYNGDWMLRAEFSKSPLSTIWGLVPFLDGRLIGAQPAWVSELVGGFAAALSLLFVFSLVRLFKRPQPLPYRLLISVVACAALLVALSVYKGQAYQAGKAIQLLFPFMFLIMASWFTLSPASPSSSRLSLLRRAAGGLLIVWLISQILIVVPTSYLASENQLIVGNLPPRRQQFNISAITAVLDQGKPGMIYVNVPPDQDWIFPFYLMFALQRYPVYFVSGIITDNSVHSNLKLLPPPAQPPSMLLQARGVPAPDNVRLLKKRAETADLELYDVEPIHP